MFHMKPYPVNTKATMITNMNAREWATARRKPFTERGILRKACIRCGQPARFQWQICSDGNNWRPLCGPCDVALNAVVLAFMGHPDADAVIAEYRVGKEAPR
jgi:hypothetical protein